MFLFHNADNSAGVAVALDSLAGANADRVVKKILVGAPVATKIVTLYNSSNAVGGATSNIAFKLTLPASIVGDFVEVDFTSLGSDAKKSGLILNGGGSIVTDAAMAVTVIFEDPDA